MSVIVEKFVGSALSVTGELLSRLDRNFQRVATQPEVVATTLDGYTFKTSDQVVSLQVDATAGALTIYLPEQPTGNRRRTIIKTDSSANAVTVDGNGSLINGAATQSLAAQYDSVTVEPTGTGWLIVAST